MATIKSKVNSRSSLIEWCESLVEFHDEHKYIQVTATDKRSLAMNALQNYWYRVISVHTGMTEPEVRAHCKYEFGRGILLRRDLELNDLLKSVDWQRRANNWNMSVYEAKVLFFSKIPVTSTFSPEEEIEYLKAMKAHYEPFGIKLPSRKDLDDTGT